MSDFLKSGGLRVLAVLTLAAAGGAAAAQPQPSSGRTYGPVQRPLPGAQPSITLPKTVDATFADGHVAPVGITWQTPDRSRLKRIGDSVTVQGQLANSAATPATARITVGASR